MWCFDQNTSSSRASDDYQEKSQWHDIVSVVLNTCLLIVVKGPMPGERNNWNPSQGVMNPTWDVPGNPPRQGVSPAYIFLAIFIIANLISLNYSRYCDVYQTMTLISIIPFRSNTKMHVLDHWLTQHARWSFVRGSSSDIPETVINYMTWLRLIIEDFWHQIKSFYISLVTLKFSI